ncbi:hypothetical protein BSLG_004306 [Batrachochytrium salamandrivorans]|nr:hypothetical protein BSLG_004306 [Batrachochytrium salamandrivorans]
MDSAKSIGLTALYSFPERHGKVSKAMSMPDFQIDRVDGCGPSSTLCTNHSNNTISTAGATATKNKISVHSSSAPSLRSSKQGRCINLPIIPQDPKESIIPDSSIPESALILHPDTTPCINEAEYMSMSNSEETALPQAHQNTPLLNDLKRKNTPDIDLSTVISHLLIRLVTTCECNQSNIYAMVKKNLVSAVMRCLQFYYKEYLVANPTPDLPNLSNRLDDVLSSMLTLLLRLAKFEIVPAFIQYKTIISISEKLLKSPPPQINQAKLDCVVDLLALNTASESTLLLSTIEHDFGKRMFESSDGVRILTDLLYTALHTSDGANAAISSTNSIPALLVAVLRTSLSRSDLPFLERIRVREFPLLSDQAITTGLNKTDCTGAADIDKSSNPIFNSSDPGEANSKPRLSECLDNTIASENTPSKALKEPSVKVKSITNPSILITYGDYLKMMDDHISRVRNPSLSENGKEKLCTASHTFSANSLKELSLTRQNSNEPNLETPKHFSGKQVKDDNVSNKDSDAVRSHVDQQLQSLVDRLNRFCPELLPLKHQLASANEPLVPNIRVRHVQPMALGKHIVCRSICPVDPELQIRKSPLGLRRAAFEHTEKMLKMTPKGTLVYDVMQDQIALDALALNDSTLHFDSRFESGNLQMAIKTSQFEYDLMVQSDINTQQGKHNQVHPGESNSSYIMNGLIQFLLSEDSTAVSLRRKCIFKIVPMLNPDGVVNGRLGNQPLLVCDFHGHSRRKNAFVYGCENGPGDAEGLEKVMTVKESTSRIVMWREFGIINSFTLESSYCGADFGERKGTQFSISDLERMGADFCRGLLALTQEPKFNGREMLLSSPIPPVVAQFGSGDTKCASGKYTNDCVNVHGADVAVESFNDISRPKCTTQSTSTVVSTSSRLCKTSSGSASAVKGSKKKGQGRGFNTSTPPRPAPSSSKESTLSEGTSKLRSRSPKKKHSTGSRSSLRTTQSSQASPLTEIKKSRKGTKQNSTDRLATNACENLSGGARERGYQ